MAMREETIQQTVPAVAEQLQRSMLYVQLLKAAQGEVTRSNMKLTELKRGVMGALAKSGWERKLRNAVYQALRTVSIAPPTVPHDHLKEPIAYIRKAQAGWEKRIIKSLNSMCTELNIPLARRRPDKEQKEMAAKWIELSTIEPDVSQFRPVYAHKDFLEVIASLKDPNYLDNHDNAGASGFWGVIQVPLDVKDMQQLRLQFSDMSINQCQCGVDDSSDIPAELFDQERTRLAKKVVGAQHGPLAQEFAKKGLPLGQRGQLYCQILGIEVDDIDQLYYEQLKACVLQYDLLVDSLIFKDVKLTATNDDQYFVFEDYIFQVLFPFSRDTAVLRHFDQSSATPSRAYIRGHLGVEECAVTYPPNGVIPFHGFAMYVSPLCYIYNDPVALYFVFREMYTRYFFRLHTLSSHPQGIVALCLLFETLIQRQEPQLFYHMKTHSISPLRIAFKWLIRAFSGFLASEQVLQVWDRILAYDSLEILSVLALAIFSFRKTNLMQVQSHSAAEAVLADLTTLKVIPMIQLTLFSQK